MGIEKLLPVLGGDRAVYLIRMLKKARHRHQVMKIIKSDASDKEKCIVIFGHFVKYGEDLRNEYLRYKERNDWRCWCESVRHSSDRNPNQNM